jgi:hypothetical protein
LLGTIAERREKVSSAIAVIPAARYGDVIELYGGNDGEACD